MRRTLYALACMVALYMPAGFAQGYELAPMDPNPLVDGGSSVRPVQQVAPQPVPTRVIPPAEASQGEQAPDLQEEKGLKVVVPADVSGRPPVERFNVPRDRTRVAVLCYHDFSETRPVSDMLMRTSEFREQMEYIYQAGYTVISIQEFLEWRFGALELPAKCVLITMDDGWRSVYTEAYPILREYKYPFTVFFYTDFLSGRGLSMTRAMVREMQKHGMTVGSHSSNHLYPSAWQEKEAEGEEAYAEMVEQELGESQKRLSKLFGRVNTYCFPGGYVTKPMLDRLPGYGYVAAFGVAPGKVTCQEDPWQIHRYMIYGTDPGIFRQAMDFRLAQTGSNVSTGSTPGTLPGNTPPPPFPVHPQPHTTVPVELPTITADLSGVAGVDYSSVRMKVSGFGRVPARADLNARSISWTPPYRIYMPNISVHVTWQTSDGASHKAEWSFKVDQDVTLQQ